MKRFSILVSTRDRWTECCTLLQSLRTQTFQNFDIIIIDGSQTPIIHSKPLMDLISRMKVEGHNVLIEGAKLLGVCESRNQAIELEKQLKNEFCCRVDDDVILLPDYLKKFNEMFNEGADLVSGVTPLLSLPEFERDTDNLKEIINEIKFNEQGEMIEYHDDCGMAYTDEVVLPAHHLRSCFAYKREITDSGIRYELGIGQVGFREEDFFCLRAAWAGWNKMLVNTKAVAWHIMTNSGGCRYPDYNLQVEFASDHFVKWVKRIYLEKGNPFEAK